MKPSDKAKLTLFAVRHLVGAAIFVWLTYLAWQFDRSGPWYVVALIGLAYVAFAAFMWRRLLYLYQRRRP